MAKWTKVITYKSDAFRVEFHTLLKGSIPGFTHRVLIYSGAKLLAADFLSDTHNNPTAKSADFFTEKHEAVINKALGTE